MMRKEEGRQWKGGIEGRLAAHPPIERVGLIPEETLEWKRQRALAGRATSGEKERKENKKPGNTIDRDAGFTSLS